MINPARFRNSNHHKNHYRPLSKNKWSPSHRQFQKKYTSYLLVSTFGAITLFLGVAYFKLSENYNLFKSLALDTFPELVQHIERELTWFSIFAVLTSLFVFIFCLLIGIRMTSNLIRPVLHMERHMRKILNGDMQATDFLYSDNDDLVEILDTYSMMYRNFRSQIESDIALLEQISIDPNDRQSLALRSTLVEKKRHQLRLKPQKTAPENSTQKVRIKIAAKKKRHLKITAVNAVKTSGSREHRHAS